MIKIPLLLIIFFNIVWGSEPIGIIKSIQGKGFVERDTHVFAINVGESIYGSDIVKTGSNSNIGISFNDGTRMVIGPMTSMKVDEFIFDPSQKNFKFEVMLPKGTMVFESGKIGKLAPEKVKIKVPQGIIGIRGTKFTVEAE